MRILITILSIFLSVSLIFASENSILIDSAEVYYQNKQYDKAAEAYEQIISGGYESSEIYFNLGNSLYKLNKVPQAIINYERAKLLAPDDEDIAFNLELANKHVVDKIEAIPEIYFITWFKNFINTLNTDYWAYISLLSFIGALLLLSLFLYSSNITLKKIGFWLGALFIVGSIATFVFSYNQKQHITNHNTAIVYSPSVTVRSSPDKSGTHLFVIHEGLKVKVTDKVGEWVEVKLADGNMGWMPEDDLEMI